MIRLERAFFGLGLIITEVLVQLFFTHLKIGVANAGVSFGLAENISLMISVVVILAVLFGKRLAILEDWGWWFIFVGGAANISSRLASGRVWDYIQFGRLIGIPQLWNNGADIMIAVGVLLLVSDLRKNGKRDTNTLGRPGRAGHK